MKKLIYILSITLLISCSKKVYMVESSTMIKEPFYVKVKERRANNIIHKMNKKGIDQPNFTNGELEFYFEHLDSTIRFRPNEIKQLKK